CRHAIALPACRRQREKGIGPFLNLKIEISRAVPWRVEILNKVVSDEMATLPADIQARFTQLMERIAGVGLEKISAPIVRYLEGNLWELRLTGRDGIGRALHVVAIGSKV